MIPPASLPSFRSTLITGGYNLLLGSGISLDSRNGLGEPLRSSEQLRRDLCSLTGAREATSLSRVSALLTTSQRERELVDRFSNCTPGPSVKHIGRFLWRRLFTFNIDDAIENYYSLSTRAKQTLIPLNFDAPFEPTPQRHELQSLHLHGWVKQPTSGFVFSASEYVRVMTSLNPWMHLLSEILASESFIIAGTSLNEIDLEYYLNHRSPATPRRGRGPSLFIEPHPDVATRADCERYGLVLIEATFGDFMSWLQAEVPSPPSVADLIIPDSAGLFASSVTQIQLLRFYSDFELVAASELPASGVPSPFLYGREPQWRDLDEHVDIERSDNAVLTSLIDKWGSASAGDHARMVLLLDDAGTGKSTTVKRIAHTLTTAGKPVLAVRTLSRIDTRNAIECLSRATTGLCLLVDGFADHVDQIMELLDDPLVASHVVVLGAERGYRRDHLDLILKDAKRHTKSLSAFTLDECQQLIERYRRYGLIGSKRATQEPREFAKAIVGDPVAIAVCRILNDFRPLDRIIDSLWEASEPEDRLPYLCVALAQHCYWAGLRHSILQHFLGPQRPVDRLIDSGVPLPLTSNVREEEFLVALNPLIGERILLRAVSKNAEQMQEAFIGIGRALAPHVNRNAIMRRSPEARLAGRLFDADKIARPFLGHAAEAFYITVQPEWAWNSRYWEQRALLVAGSDLGTALQYGRHAVSVEAHPFPLTTLGKLLLRQMEVDPSEREGAFLEAFQRLSSAIDIEARRGRITIHPFAILISGTARYLELGGVLRSEQRERINLYMVEAEEQFAGDALMEGAVRHLEALLT